MGDLNLSYRPIRSLSGSFQLNTLRDLDQRKTEEVLGLFSVNVGTEIGRKQNFKYTFSPEITSWLSPSYSYNTNYTENHTPEVSNSLGDSLDLRNFSNNTSRDLTINIGIPKLLSAMAGGGGAGVQRVDRVGGQKSEDEVVEEKKDGLWTRSMNRASRIMKNATVRFGRDKLTDYDYVEISPPFMYQLGFKGLDLPPRELRKSRDLSVDGGMTLPAGISLNSGYSERETTSDFRGSSRFSNNITWPKVGLDISNVKLPIKLKEYMTSLSFRSQYSKSKEVSGTGTSGVESQRRGTTWSPFLSTSCQMKNGLAVTYSINRGETETLNFTGSRNTNLRENSSHQLNLNYSLRSSRGLGLPIPGLSSKKLKLSSDLRFQLAFSRGTTREVVVRPDGDDTEIINNVTTSFAPSADYDFSRITTGLRFNYNVVNDKKSDQRRITIGANIWMEFLF
jgi:hypothetical protein